MARNLTWNQSRIKTHWCAPADHNSSGNPIANSTVSAIWLSDYWTIDGKLYFNIAAASTLYSGASGSASYNGLWQAGIIITDRLNRAIESDLLFNVGSTQSLNTRLSIDTKQQDITANFRKTAGSPVVAFNSNSTRSNNTVGGTTLVGKGYNLSEIHVGIVGNLVGYPYGLANVQARSSNYNLNNFAWSCLTTKQSTNGGIERGLLYDGYNSNCISYKSMLGSNFATQAAESSRYANGDTYPSNKANSRGVLKLKDLVEFSIAIKNLNYDGTFDYGKELDYKLLGDYKLFGESATVRLQKKSEGIWSNVGEGVSISTSLQFKNVIDGLRIVIKSAELVPGDELRLQVTAQAPVSSGGTETISGVSGVFKLSHALYGYQKERNGNTVLYSFDNNLSDIYGIKVYYSFNKNSSFINPSDNSTYFKEYDIPINSSKLDINIELYPNVTSYCIRAYMCDSSGKLLSSFNASIDATYNILYSVPKATIYSSAGCDAVSWYTVAGEQGDQNYYIDRYSCTGIYIGELGEDSTLINFYESIGEAVQFATGAISSDTNPNAYTALNAYIKGIPRDISCDVSVSYLYKGFYNKNTDLPDALEEFNHSTMASHDGLYYSNIDRYKVIYTKESTAPTGFTGMYVYNSLNWKPGLSFVFKDGKWVGYTDSDSLLYDAQNNLLQDSLSNDLCYSGGCNLHIYHNGWCNANQPSDFYVELYDSEGTPLYDSNSLRLYCINWSPNMNGG